MKLKRCNWCGTNPLYVNYHDNVWGRPVGDSLELFKKLCLDGQQAGLSWFTILQKQQHYDNAYEGFIPEKLASWDESNVFQLMQNTGIVRNRLKIESIIKNARGFLRIEARGESFNHFLWKYVEGKPVINKFTAMAEVPAYTQLSAQMSKDLKKQGFNFVGKTIVYAFMQAVGMVNDHLLTCPQYQPCKQIGESFRCS